MTVQSYIQAGKRPLRPADAALVCKIAHDRGGLAISAEKLSLLEQRLSRRMRVTGHAEFADYIADLTLPGSAAEIVALVEALTTNTTSFFREPAQFDWMRTTGLPERMAAGAGRERPLVIWSAACSTGAEMWTAAMTLDQVALSIGGALRWQVIGSDLSAEMLRRASDAIYAENEITGLTEEYRKRYLLRSREPRGSGHLYRIGPELRSRARLYQANLVNEAPKLDVAVDMAMLRNVLIYFDETGRAIAVDNVVSRLAVGGYLLTGHTESLNPIPIGLTQVAPSIYRKT